MPVGEDSGIVTIRTRDPRSRQRSIALDGVETRTTSRDALKSSGIAEGDVHSEASIERELAEPEVEMAMRRAIRLLEYRERSVAELQRRLVDDGYPRRVAAAVTGRMAESGLVDDARFTESYVRTKRSASWGRRRIERGLADSGVDPQIATEVLERELPHHGEVTRALETIGESDTTDRRNRDKVLRKLISRGFSYPDALEALSERAARASTENRNDFES